MAIKDFKAKRIRAATLITTGTGPGLLVYSSTNATNFAGGVSDSAMLTNVGTDVFLFVSGTSTYRSGPGQWVNTRDNVALFGGDVVVSGTLWADRSVIEVDGDVTGSLHVSGTLFVSQSVEIREGLIVNQSGESGSENDFRVQSSARTHALYVNAGGEQVFVLSGNSGYPGASPDESTYTDLNFFVSGTIGSRGSSTKGTAVFGGDTVISGTVNGINGISGSYVETGLIKTTVGSLTIDSVSDIALSADGDQITMDDGSTTRFTFNVDSTPELDVAGDFIIDASGDVTLDAGGGNWYFLDGGSGVGEFANDSGHFVISSSKPDYDIVFKGQSAGGTSTEIARVDTSTSVFSGSTVETGLLKSIGPLVVTSSAALTLDSQAYIDFDDSTTNYYRFYLDSTPKLSVGYDFEIFALGDITLNAWGGDVVFQAPKEVGDATFLTISRPSGGGDYPDAAFKDTEGAEIFRIDASEDSLLMAGSNQIQFTDANEAIWGDGSNLHLKATSAITIMSGGAPASPDESTYTDTSFFVSGTAGSKDSAVKGTALFGGDLVVSGGLYVSTPGVGQDVKFHSIASDRYFHWDPDVGEGGSLILGTSGGGSDFVVYGETAGRYLWWDQSEDRLYVNGNLTAGYGLQVTGSSGQHMLQATVNTAPVALGDLSSTNSRSMIIIHTDDSTHNGDIVLAPGADGDDGKVFVGIGRRQSGGSYIPMMSGEGIDTSMGRGKTAQVLVMSGGAPASPDESTYTDTSFFVSGTAGSKDSAVKGTALFGGDLVTSGALFVADTISGSIHHTAGGLSYLVAGDNITIVSASNGQITVDSLNSSGWTDDGTVVRLSTATDSVGIGTTSPAADLEVGDTAGSSATGIYVGFPSDSSGSLAFNRESFGLSTVLVQDGSSMDFAIVNSGTRGEIEMLANGYSSGGSNAIIQSAFRFIPHDFTDAPSKSAYAGPQLLFFSGVSYGSTAASLDPTGFYDTNFWVSGSIGSRGVYKRGTAVFGGDTVISGALLVGGEDFHAETGAAVGGTISGSIHHTSGGISYLVAGDNITVASASNGQVTIASTATGGGGDAVGWFSGSSAVHGDLGAQPDWISSSGSLALSGTNLDVGQYIRHVGDTSTSIRFDDGRIRLYTEDGTGAAKQMMQLDGTPSVAGTPNIMFNGDARDWDFAVIGRETGKISILVSGTYGSPQYPNAGTNDTNLFLSGTQVLILSGGAAASADVASFTDTNFFVSGTIGSKNTSFKGAALFGGDLVASGALHALDTISGSIHHTAGGLSYLAAGSNITIASASNGQITITSTATGGGGGDAVGWFSGSAGGGAGTGAGAGWISTSGSLAISGSYLDVKPSGAFSIRRSEKPKNNIEWPAGGGLILRGNDSSDQSDANNIFIYLDQDSGDTPTNRILLNAAGGLVDFEVWGNNYKSLIRTDASLDQVAILSGAVPTGAQYLPDDVGFSVSGTIGSRHSSNGFISTFGGDTVVSGTLIAGGSNFHALAGSSVGGTISGSIHHTSGGLSYLVAGSNVTVTSASNGQVTITSTAGGTVDGSGAATRLAYWSDADTLTSDADLIFDGDTLTATNSSNTAIPAIKIDRNYTGTTSIGNYTTDPQGLLIDYDVTGIVATGQTAIHDALAINYNQDSPTMVGTIEATGADIRMTGGTSGTQSMKGVAINLAGADTHVGVDVTAPNDSTHFIARSSDSLLDNFQISVGAAGATTLSTSDADASAADLTLDVDGDIVFDADGGNWSFDDAGSRQLDVTGSSGDVVISVPTEDKDLTFKVNSGSTTTTALNIDGSTGGVRAGAAIGGQATSRIAFEVNYGDTGDAGLAENQGGGEIVTFGSFSGSGWKKGALRYLHTDGEWLATTGSSPSTGGSQLLAIALGNTSPSEGMLIRGFFNAKSGPGSAFSPGYLSSSFAIGQPVYVASGGAEYIQSAAPGRPGDIVRIIGHGTTDANIIYFNPDSTWIENS